MFIVTFAMIEIGFIKNVYSDAVGLFKLNYLTESVKL